MYRIFWLLVVMLLSIVALASDSPKEYDDATFEGADLEGSWYCVSTTCDGQRPIGNLPHFETFHDGIVSSGLPLPTVGFLNGRYKVNTGRKPAYLDVKYASRGFSWTEHGIYEVKGNTLRIAFRIRGERPAKFDEIGNVTLHTFTRVKKPQLD